MKRLPRIHSLLMVLCALLVGAQAGGAHVHYCLDGQARPVSVHYGAAEAQGNDEATAPHATSAATQGLISAHHTDVIVAFGSDAPLKKFDGQGDPPDPHAIPVHAPALARATGAVLVAVSPSTPALSPRHVVPPPARAPPR